MFRSDFPIFTTHPDLVYLDSASSAQKPKQVIDSLSRYFASDYANIHRWAYDLSLQSSLLYEKAKKAVAKKLHASSDAEIVFTYNATYAFNLIAQSLVKSGYLTKGDTVLLSKVEHHANIVPWQIIAAEHGILIDWVELHADGTLDYDSLAAKLPNAKVLSITGASNVTGEVLDLDRVKGIFDGLDTPFVKGGRGDLVAEKNPQSRLHRDSSFTKELTRPIFILDGSQRFPHMETDVVRHGIDFFVATGHKVMSDTGIGFYYGRKDILQKMDPAFCGGGAINSVTISGYEPAGLPFRHEPGTPHIAGAVSLLAALEYIDSIGGFATIEKYEQELTEYALERFEEAGFLADSVMSSEAIAESRHLAQVGWEDGQDFSLRRNDGNTPTIRLLGSKNPENRLGVFSFVFDGKHPNDISEALADADICVRSGHHCTDVLHTTLGIWGSLRVSLYLYNTREDVDRLVEIIMKFL
jgi:cysteine desulfurase / selenocysteine lyase